MTKLTAKELWDAIDDAAIDLEIEAALAKTPEEHRRDLIAAGVDLDAVHAKADALFASSKQPVLTASEVAAGSRAPRSMAKRRRLRVEIVAPLALALAAGVALWAHSDRATYVGSAMTAPERAALLRRDAKADCDALRWRLCLEALDKARALDPAGDEKPETMDLRRLAEAHRH